MQAKTVRICSCTGLNGDVRKRLENGVVDLIAMVTLLERIPYEVIGSLLTF
jgi:hypothetical protein